MDKGERGALAPHGATAKGAVGRVEGLSLNVANSALPSSSTTTMQLVLFRLQAVYIRLFQY